MNSSLPEAIARTGRTRHPYSPEAAIPARAHGHPGRRPSATNCSCVCFPTSAPTRHRWRKSPNPWPRCWLAVRAVPSGHSVTNAPHATAAYSIFFLLHRRSLRWHFELAVALSLELAAAAAHLELVLGRPKLAVDAAHVHSTGALKRDARLQLTTTATVAHAGQSFAAAQRTAQPPQRGDRLPARRRRAEREHDARGGERRVDR
ncbi:unnamed protein product [Urochloa humidicola]